MTCVGRYFLNGRSLTAKIVDSDSIHADMFKVCYVTAHSCLLPDSSLFTHMFQGCDRPFVKINWKQQVTCELVQGMSVLLFVSNDFSHHIRL